MPGTGRESQLPPGSHTSALQGTVPQPLPGGPALILVHVTHMGRQTVTILSDICVSWRTGHPSLSVSFLSAADAQRRGPGRPLTGRLLGGKHHRREEPGHPLWCPPGLLSCLPGTCSAGRSAGWIDAAERRKAFHSTGRNFPLSLFFPYFRHSTMSFIHTISFNSDNLVR